jgi:DMSO/TMAO reductase YedYZ molybdopterin-dependent catalytic subunit
MDLGDLPRREFLIQGGAAVAGLTLANFPFPAGAVSSQPGEVVIPWLDEVPANPAPGEVVNLLEWEDLDSRLTPNDKFFGIMHYEWPSIDEATWKLEIDGLVRRPLTFTLPELKSRPRQEVDFTLECSGNHGFPWFIGGIGTAKWAGTPLAAILQEAEPLENGVEVVFVGTDSGEETIRDTKVRQNFARSMSLADALSSATLLCYEMNGSPLPERNGYPLRLIAPGWYGIANVKWLKRIEVRNTRFMGRFMARDYVTLREERRGNEVAWVATSVGRSLLKSVPARVTRHDGRYRIIGAAWGGPVARVDVQIDHGPWLAATIDRSEDAEHAWKLWSLDWETSAAGEHSITSRAVDTFGRIQPSMSDPDIASKKTYWESNGQVTRRIQVA